VPSADVGLVGGTTALLLEAGDDLLVPGRRDPEADPDRPPTEDTVLRKLRATALQFAPAC
jgi:hypothetical protein